MKWDGDKFIVDQIAVIIRDIPSKLYKMFSESPKIPIAILIFNDNNNFTYKAYSPANYDINDEVGVEEAFGRFLAQIYNKISYQNENPLNNNTSLGKLQEVHTRYIDIPLESRSEVAYFSTYENPHCQYAVIHRESPIHFDVIAAADYAQLQNQLGHLSCTHEFV